MIVQPSAVAKGWPIATTLLPASCGPADPKPEPKPKQRRLCRKVSPLRARCGALAHCPIPGKNEIFTNVNHSHISIPSPRLLLVEDDPRLREDLDAHFRRRGFRVTVCGDGSHGLEAAGREAFDLVLLDIMLPSLDGLALLESLRREQATPVMLMSALGAEQDRISGFTRGADDYLPKPFSLAELDARTDALLRRVRLDRLPSAQRRDTRLVFDDQAQDVLHQGLPAGLTPSEYRLLATLREHAGEALSKPFLYRSVLHRSYTRLDRGLDVHVCNLRRKLAVVAVRHLQIQAVRGQGYLLVETEHP
ncbi:response regulator transcription factor [Pseudomonas aeruginosa]|nr:two-component system response regulator PfeR [Pseudomonas aeruginosa]KAA5628375.1 response regulator transcription factor [Pseudomonas aeruginosa]MBX6272711.1 response regulator transcription factor [Pseudomonas aeruginosa]WBM17898.1 two-component system response regulator PfeR [Pseudomonas aeruginosa]